jgi:tRNA(adenine34) deaminase
MAQALDGARAATQHGDVPIGALVVHDGIVIGAGHNKRELDRDPTAHAELIALREAAKTLDRWRLTGCALYVTLEPCAMCAGAAVLARVDLVVFAAPDPKAGAVRSVAELLDEPALNHHPKWRVMRGARRSEAEALLSGFFAGRRDREDGPQNAAPSTTERGESMKLNGVLIGTDDPGKLKAYYTKLFGKPAWEDGGYFGWQFGDAGVAFGAHDEVKGKNQQPGRVIWGLESSDVKGEFDRLKAAGATVVREPYQMGDNPGWIATLSDPDNNYFQLMSPMPQPA